MPVYTRAQTKARKEQAATILTTRLCRRDPISMAIVRHPFWIHRKGSSRCYDVCILAAYIRRSRDLRDVVCRVPYTTPELCGISIYSGDVALRRFVTTAPTDDATSDLILQNALDDIVLSNVHNIVQQSGRASAFYELFGSVNDLLLVSSPRHVDHVLDHAMTVLMSGTHQTTDNLDRRATYMAVRALRLQLHTSPRPLPQHPAFAARIQETALQTAQL